MTEPDDDALRARLARLDPAAGSLPPLAVPRRHRRPGPGLVAAAAVLAVLVGAVTAVVAAGGEGRATPDVLAVESPTPEPSASPTPQATTASPSPSASRPAASPPPSPVPGSPSASAGTPRATTAPTLSPTAAPETLSADEMLEVEVSVAPDRAATGNQLRVTVTIHSTSEQMLTLLRSDSCGKAFGDVIAPGTGIVFDGGGDVCGGGSGEKLLPGAGSQQWAYARIRDTAAAGTFEVVAVARFAVDGRTYEVSGHAPVTLFDKADGTRTLTLVNDTDEPLSVECPGCLGVGMLGYPTVKPGGQLSVTSSVFNDVESRPGQVTLTPVRSSSLEAYALRTCLDIRDLEKGTQGTVVLASSATPCPVRPRS